VGLDRLVGVDRLCDRADDVVAGLLEAGAVAVSAITGAANKDAATRAMATLRNMGIAFQEKARRRELGVTRSTGS